MSSSSSSSGSKRKAVAIWDTDKIEYGTLGFQHDARGRIVPVISIYTHIAPTFETFHEYDYGIPSFMYKRKEVWLDEPPAVMDGKVIEEWGEKVGALMYAFHNAISFGECGSWYDAKYFNGGRYLPMIFTELQEAVLQDKDKRAAYEDKIIEIATQERRERKAEVDKWLKRIDEAVMMAAGVKV